MVDLSSHSEIRRIVQEVLEAREEIRSEQVNRIIDARIDKLVRTAMVAYLVPMIVVAFFLGGLWIKFQDVPAVLDGRGVWMRTIEVRLGELERHAVRLDADYEKPSDFELPD